VTWQSVVMLGVFLLRVTYQFFMLNVVMLSVVAQLYVFKLLPLPCSIFEHFAIKPEPVTELIKVGSSIIFKHFATNWIQ